MAQGDCITDSLEFDIERFCSDPSKWSDLGELLLEFQNKRESWDVCTNILRQNCTSKCDWNDKSLLPILIFCSNTLKVHAYNGFANLATDSHSVDKSTIYYMFDTCLKLLLDYETAPRPLQLQLSIVAAVCIILSFDTGQHFSNLLLSEALLKTKDYGFIQGLLLQHVAEEAFNNTLRITPSHRAAFVRCCIMLAPRILNRLAKIKQDHDENVNAGVVFQTIDAIGAWIHLHSEFILHFEGFSTSAAQGLEEKIDEDTISINIPVDDSILIRNTLHSIIASKLIQWLFEILENAILNSNFKPFDSCIGILEDILGLAQVGITRLLLKATGDLEESEQLSWEAACKAVSVSAPVMLPILIRTYLDGFERVIKMIIVDFQDEFMYNCLRQLLKLLVSFACEHLPFAIHFMDSKRHQYLPIFNLVNGALFSSSQTLREYALDFWATLQGHSYLSPQDGHLEIHKYAVPEIISILKPHYVTHLSNLYKTLIHKSKPAGYGTLCAEAIRDVLMVTGIDYVLELLEADVKILNKKFTWLLAERCAFMVTIIAGRLQRGINDIVNVVIYMTTRDYNFRLLQRCYFDSDIIRIQRTIAEMIISASGYICTDRTLLFQSLQLLLNCLLGNKFDVTRAATGIRALCFRANLTRTYAMTLLRELVEKASDLQCPLECRIELILTVEIILNSQCRHLSPTKAVDYIEVLLNKLGTVIQSCNVDGTNGLVESSEVKVFLAILFISYFGFSMLRERGRQLDFNLMPNLELDILNHLKHLPEFWTYFVILLETVNSSLFNRPITQDHYKSVSSVTSLRISPGALELLKWALEVTSQYSELESIHFSLLQTILSHLQNYKDKELCLIAMSCLHAANINLLSLLSLDGLDLDNFLSMYQLHLSQSLICTSIAMDSLYTAQLLCEWAGLPDYIIYVMDLLPSGIPEVDAGAILLFYKLSLWIPSSLPLKQSPQDELGAGLKQMRVVIQKVLQFTRNGCNITLLEKIVQSIFTTIAHRSCQMERWIHMAAAILFIVATCVSAGPGIIKGVIQTLSPDNAKYQLWRILGAKGPNEIAQLLRNFGTC
ncbi:bifunctional Armadillo-type fold/Armadillo-like helical [Babesia duncani]|uniref:Bifunctional Armadillo-type fold/Armadillo-like helical n=1 Tax=Babesia duncani TaxID=323732 RepID=A0AAD9UPL1_9APIC|nr:bifunctional Armadillo-type fold/Armadillo-like helical [Babesia duncani]